MATIINNIRQHTNLPIEVRALTGQINMVVVVQTPHKGQVTINTKEKNYPFIFGSVTETEKGSKLIAEINKLEIESRDFLFNEWRKNFN